jgi:BirA family transcriptional regulator, biotin operon repressor / biotin---[acetyl-CoA-carboxylase] ligase
MKAQILQQLRNSKGILSGERLSSRLGISRVAVWKHIQKLLESGYQIESGPKGYRLTASPDTPFAWEFPAREPHFHYFPEVSSTMDIARNLARKGCPDFTVVVADKQVSGRGRMDRRWESSAGGLYFTMILRPKISLIQSPLLNFAASLVLSQTIREQCHIEAMVKWPNDILVQDRKLSGMLSEMETEAELVSFINIGIGININNTPSQDIPSASSIKSITGRTHNRKEFLSDYLDRLDDRLRNHGLETVITEWKACAATLGRQVKVVTRTGVTQGTAVDVDEGGALVVRIADGSLKKVYYGDCFHTSEGKVRHCINST